MEENFEWSDKLIFSIKINQKEYWYTLFRTLFWFPEFKRHVIWYQEEEEDEYYNQQHKKPPKKKRKKEQLELSDEDEEDEMITEFSLETINEFFIPKQFRPQVEVGFRKDGEEFDFDMKYSHAKIAAVLTAIGSEQYSPDIWNDHLIVSICDSMDKILASTEMTLAALCICIRFDNFDELYEKVFESEKTKTSRIAISTQHKPDHPQCYIEIVDNNAVAKNGTFEWICRPGKNSFLPNHSWNTFHGEFTEIRYRAIMKDGDEDHQLLSIEKHSIYMEFP